VEKYEEGGYSTGIVIYRRIYYEKLQTAVYSSIGSKQPRSRSSEFHEI
jgi:hypothetical protein